jgi:hypothetical protein
MAEWSCASVPGKLGRRRGLHLAISNLEAPSAYPFIGSTVRAYFNVAYASWCASMCLYAQVVKTPAISMADMLQVNPMAAIQMLCQLCIPNHLSALVTYAYWGAFECCVMYR